MTTRTIETFISKANVKAQVIPWMMAGGLINKEEDLVDMDFKNSGDLIPITLTVQKLAPEESAEQQGNG